MISMLLAPGNAFVDVHKSVGRPTVWVGMQIKRENKAALEHNSTQHIPYGSLRRVLPPVAQCYRPWMSRHVDTVNQVPYVAS
jgi:hypothetical protein